MRLRVLQAVASFFVLIAVFGHALIGFASGTGDTAVQDESRLKLDLYAYFWPAGLDGDASVGSHKAHSSIKFGDIIRDLKMAGNGAFKISKSGWFLFNDFIYMDVSHKTTEEIAEVPGATLDATLGSRVMTNMLVVGRQWEKPVSWNLFAGARYFYGRIRLDAVENLIIIPPQEKLVIKTKEWVTPIVGAGVSLPLNNKLSFNFSADLGGAEKSFTWEVVPVLSWKFNNSISAEAGYRLLDIRHKEADFKMDTLMHGPIIGMKISF